MVGLANWFTHLRRQPRERRGTFLDLSASPEVAGTMESVNVTTTSGTKQYDGGPTRERPQWV